MKKVLYSLSIIIGFIPCIVRSLECNMYDKERLSQLATNITYIVEDYEDNGNTYFKVTFSGLSKEFRVFNEATLLSYYNFSDNEFGETTVERMKTGKTYNFNVYGRYTCKFNTVKNITINIPSINVYYSDELCKDIGEYKLCQKWTNNNGISYEEFASRVTEYKNNKNNIEDKENISNNQNNNYFDFMDIYNKYYLPTFICMICLLVILIILWIRENKKNKL